MTADSLNKSVLNYLLLGNFVEYVVVKCRMRWLSLSTESTSEFCHISAIMNYDGKSLAVYCS